jgi:hypothetical protein
VLLLDFVDVKLCKVLFLDHCIESEALLNEFFADFGECSVWNDSIAVTITEAQQNMDLEGSQIELLASIESSLALLNGNGTVVIFIFFHKLFFEMYLQLSHV